MPATLAPSPDQASALAAIVGPRGVLDADATAPLLREWRGRWTGAAAMALAPASVEEVAAVVRYCAAEGVAITPQGGNTGLVGGQTPQGGVIVTLRRLDRIREVSPADNSLIADAGVTLAAAQAAARAADRLFPLSIGSEGSCQIGGAVSTNAGGVNVLRYGNMRDLVLGLEVVLPSGEIWNGLKRLRKDNTGYDLKQLFIGGEGTLGIVTGAALKLFAAPRERATVFAAVPSPAAALALLNRAQGESGGAVTSFELIGRLGLALVLKHIAGARDPFPAPHAWTVLLEFSAGREGALAPVVEATLAGALEAGEILDAVVAANERQAADFWRLRHSLSEAMKPEGGQAKYDVSTPVAAVPTFLAAADEAVARVVPGARVVAFGHMGDGNIHYDVLQPEGGSKAAFEAAGEAIEQAVYDCIDRFGGSISAEHGVGLARRDDIARRKAPAEIAMMRAVKRALDPVGIMNPGKML